MADTSNKAFKTIVVIVLILVIVICCIKLKSVYKVDNRETDITEYDATENYVSNNRNEYVDTEIYRENTKKVDNNINQAYLKLISLLNNYGYTDMNKIKSYDLYENTSYVNYDEKLLFCDLKNMTIEEIESTVPDYCD